MSKCPFRARTFKTTIDTTGRTSPISSHFFLSLELAPNLLDWVKHTRALTRARTPITIPAMAPGDKVKSHADVLEDTTNSSPKHVLRRIFLAMQ